MPKAVRAATAAWIMARRICCQVILFEWFIRIFVLKDLFFAISDKGEESVTLKKEGDCIQIPQPCPKMTVHFPE